MADFNIFLLARVAEGLANVLHVERGHVGEVSFDDCTCNDDADNAVVGMTTAAMAKVPNGGGTDA